MMKGGARLTLDLEGWCAIETWPWRVVRDWERVVRDWHLTLKGGVKGGVRLRLDLEGWCAIEAWSWRVVCDWDLTLKGGARLRVDLEGWCETSHDLDEGSLQIGLRLDLEGCCAIETWSWRVVCDWDLTLKGGARLRVDLEGWCETSHDLDEGCLQIGLRLDLEGWCAIETWPWWRVVADRIVMAAWMLHGLCFGEEAGARNLVFFRVKWLQPAMKGTSCVRRVRLRSFQTRLVPPMCFATSGCVCVCSSMRFLNLWLQIALEWLHECCMLYVLGRKPEHETLCFSV